MTNIERSGERDLTISAWHRRTFPDDWAAFDLDLVGICSRPGCRTQLYVWEATRATYKNTDWTAKMALRLNVPAYLVRYVGGPDSITWMEVEMVWPTMRLIGDESAFAFHLTELRHAHARLWHGQPLTTGETA